MISRARIAIIQDLYVPVIYRGIAIDVDDHAVNPTFREAKQYFTTPKVAVDGTRLFVFQCTVEWQSGVKMNRIWDGAIFIRD